MTLILPTSNTASFAGGTYNAAAAKLNGLAGRYVRLTVTPSQASTAWTGGNWRCVLSNAFGGVWFNNNQLEILKYPSDELAFTQALTWSANQSLTLLWDVPGRSITISGATTGNGTYAVDSGPYFDGSLLLERGSFGSGFNLPGTFSDLDDTVPNLSWVSELPTNPPARPPSSALLVSALAAPLFLAAPPSVEDLSWMAQVPEQPLRRAPGSDVEGYFAIPAETLPDAAAPEISWTSTYPEGLRRGRTEPNIGGAFGPSQSLPNAAAPELSWEPEYPDILTRPRGPQNAGGWSGPTETIPDPLPPGFGWSVECPHSLSRAPGPIPQFYYHPPLCGGTPLTVGAASLRFNINATSTVGDGGVLTTFGSDVSFTVDAGTDTCTTAAPHGMVMSAGPFRLRTTGTLPSGADSSTPYYVRVSGTGAGATTFQLALSPQLAVSGSVVNLLDSGSGVHTLVRAVDTAPLYSTFLAFLMRGVWDSAAPPELPTDSFGNTYAFESNSPHVYIGFPTTKGSVAIRFSGKGGRAHTWSGTGAVDDEVTVGGLEIFDAPYLIDSSFALVASGSATIESNPVTTTAKALLVAVVQGHGPVLQDHTFTFLDGFVKVPELGCEADVHPNGYIQHSVAIRTVDLAGTYRFRVQGVNSEGGALRLFAFQRALSELQPLDWMQPQQPPKPYRRHSVPSGLTQPIVPPLPPTDWRSHYPPSSLRRESSDLTTGTAPVVVETPSVSQWQSEYPPSIDRRLPDLSTSALPPAVAVPTPDQWRCIYPNSFPTRGRVPADDWVMGRVLESAPLPDLSWVALYPNQTSRRWCDAEGWFGPASTLPDPVPETSWRAEFPEGLRRKATEPNIGGRFGPEDLLPNPPAPDVPLAICEVAPRARPGVEGWFAGPPEVVVGGCPNPISWETIEDAIHAWITDGSCLAPEQVVWTHFKPPRRPNPFVRLELTEVETAGYDWRTHHEPHNSRPGEEVAVRHSGHRVATLEVQVFGATDRGNVALPMATRIVSALNRHEYSLDLAGVGIGSQSSVSMVSGDRDGVLEPRARFTIQLHLMSVTESRETYIERIQVLVNEPVLGETELWVPDP